MHIGALLFLGLIAGGTIYIGLPIGRVKGLPPRLNSTLSTFAAGILIFLFIEIVGDAANQTAASVRTAALHQSSTMIAISLVILLLSGFFIGLLSLVYVENEFILKAKAFGPGRLSMMIAVGIGLHNFSEGLAIGASAAQGKTALAIGLIIGFALHNATEGFGIMGPILQAGERASWKRILFLGIIGGAPTFIGTILGSLWTSTPVSVFVLAMAGGALLYVIKELLAGIRTEAAQRFVMSALVLGFGIGWGTEVVTTIAETSPDTNNAVIREADGDVITTSANSDSSLKLSKAEEARETQTANDLLHEKAMVPTILPDGTRQFVLTASVFNWSPYPGEVLQAWGYNDQVPGPLLRFKVGDKIAIVLHNDLPQPTTLHLHGLAVPNNMDGVPSMSMDGMDMGTQPPIQHGGTFTYRFTVTPQMIGTHLYHTHVNDDFQMDAGLHGVLIVDPASSSAETHHDVDALYELASFKIGGSDEENVFTMDGKSYPEAPVLNVKKGEIIRIRLVNASAEETHVMHLHGYTFKIISLDGTPVKNPISADTVNLGPSQTADIEFTANNPGNWMFHCHILDHTMNPGPDGDGSATKMADMGGLMTVIHVQ